MAPSLSIELPVYVLTGFLGAGKTSLLNDELAGYLGGDTLVIISEFGKIGIDHALVEIARDNVFLLPSGCLCCASKGDVSATLTYLSSRRRLGALPDISRIVVEMSGGADPGHLIDMLCSPATRAAGFRPGAVTTVVDALHGSLHIERHFEARRQIAMADHIVVSKTDLLPGKSLDKLAADIRAINPHAKIVSRQPGSCGTLCLDEPGSRLVNTRFSAVAGGEGFVSHLLVDREPVLWSHFSQWLSAVLSLRGAEIPRVKGLVRIAESDAPILIQGAYHWLDRPRALSAWPDDDISTRLVFITTSKGPATIELPKPHVPSNREDPYQQ
ncbi:CobW family GTP-binding protein [Pseudochelatococcus sp. B33]